MDEAVSIDMLPFLIAAIAGRKSLRQLIDETYSKNCIAYHDAALSSPYYNHKISRAKMNCLRRS